jgi:glycosyltransferase involved in cell wall biosynthesis
MRSLARRHELSVISFSATDEFKEPALKQTRSYCKDVICFPDLEFQDRSQKRLLQLRSVVSRRSYEHLLFARRAEFTARLQRLIDEGDFDIVQFEFAQMAAFRVARRTKARIVLDEHNIEFDILRRTAAADVGLWRKFYSAVNWRKLKREEQGAWQRFDGVTVTSDRDAQVLHELQPGAPLAVIPNGVDIEQFRPSEQTPDAESLLFFGAVNYHPNSDGINHFIDNVFPKILEQRPNTKLWVVGPAPKEMLARRNQNIEVTGFVDEVEPYLDRAAVVVVPLRIGGGTRLKIVEAMAKAKAIVSTRIGAEGIDVEHEKHALLADSDEDFAEQTLRLLDDHAPSVSKRVFWRSRATLGRHSPAGWRPSTTSCSRNPLAAACREAAGFAVMLEYSRTCAMLRDNREGW